MNMELLKENVHSANFWSSKEMTLNWTAKHEYDAVEPSLAAGVELDFDYEANVPWAEEVYGKRLVMFTALYVICVFGGARVMEKRPPLRLSASLKVWNLVLAVLSIAGAWRTVPEAVVMVRQHGFYPAVCISSFLFNNNVTSLWALIFTMSKVAEFGDTLFLVARKRPVIFLHWYHHITVMFFSYYCYHHAVAVARWFMTLNFFVHSFMYSYYFLRSMSVRVPKLVSMAITTMQIAQMVAASCLICAALHFKRAGSPCSLTETEASFFIGLYLSYFVLFGKFFYDSYLTPANSKKARTD